MKSYLAHALILSCLVTTPMLMQPVHASETAEGIKKDYAAFKKEANAKLAELDQKIEKLKAESKETAAEELQSARDQLQKRMEEAEKTGSTKWAQFKKSFAESVDKLNSKAQKVLRE